MSGDHVYVAWMRHTIIGGGDGEIFFVRSTDKGLTFSAPINLSSNNADSRSPRLTVSGDNVYVVWGDVASPAAANISLRRSADRGATFSPTTTLGNNARPVYPEPRIAASGNQVYVVWNEGNTDISLCRSTNGGGTFSAPSNLSNNPATSWYPQIAFAGTNVYVVWIDIAPGLQNVSFTRSADKAVSFSPPSNVSPNSHNAMNADVKASDSNVYLTWDDVNGSRRQEFFARSTNDGGSFQAPVDLSKSTDDLYAPSLAVEGNELYASWTLKTGSVQGVPNFDLVFRGSGDGGATFTAPTNLTRTPANRSVDTTIVVLDRVAYIAWSEGPSLLDADILFCTAVLYEPSPPVLDGWIERPIPDLPYRVDLHVPLRPPPPPPGPPPPFGSR